MSRERGGRCDFDLRSNTAGGGCATLRSQTQSHSLRSARAKCLPCRGLSKSDAQALSRVRSEAQPRISFRKSLAPFGKCDLPAPDAIVASTRLWQAFLPHILTASPRRRSVSVLAKQS